MRETRLWSLHILVLPIIAILLGMHFAIMHYAPVFYGMSVEEARSFEVMIERGKSIAQLVLYILLLAAGLYHGLYGLRGILRELPLTPTLV
jgi:succinate dehydrogenase hydrophobic anchor subunit